MWSLLRMLPPLTQHGHFSNYGTTSLTINKSAIYLGACVAILICVQAVHAITWSATSPGNFLTAANWGGTTPNATGAHALISTNPTNSGDFTLSGSQTLGTLDYNNSGFRALTGAGTLNFNVSSGTALFRVRQKALDVRVSSMVLNDTTEFRIEGSQVIVTSVVSGTGGINKTGVGTMSLESNSNSYTGVTSIAGDYTSGIAGDTLTNQGVNSAFGRGNLAFNNNAFLEYRGSSASTDRTISLGTLTDRFGYNNGGAIIVDNAATVLTLAGVISGGGRFTKFGPGTIQFSASNTYSGITSIYEGTVRLVPTNEFLTLAMFSWIQQERWHLIILMKQSPN